MSQKSGNAAWSSLQIIEIDASKSVPRKITDPEELARVRKRRADREKYCSAQPKPQADASPDATSPPTPS